MIANILRHIRDMLKWPAETRTPGSIADVLERWHQGTAGPWEFDDTVSIPLRNDPELQSIINEVVGLNSTFPPEVAGAYTSKHGVARLKEIIEQLRQLEQARSKSGHDECRKP